MNPFDEPENFGGSNRLGGVKSYTNTSSTSSRTIDDDLGEYERQLESYMQQSLDSTQRSRVRLEEAETTGSNTAQNLLAQREQLERTNKNLDQIDQTTIQTQLNLNKIKSVFGGLKNKFTWKSTPKTTANDATAYDTSQNRLQQTVDEMNRKSVGAANTSSGPTLNAKSRDAIKGTRWEAMDNEIDQNLVGMSDNLARLQMLGKGLGHEIDDQNKLLDEIQRKADKTDVTIRHQDNQMKKVLGYKPPKTVEDTSAFGSRSK